MGPSPLGGPGEHWWEREPGRSRLAWELQRLDDAGIPWEKDEAAFASGLARLTVHPTAAGEVIDLVVTFPDAYPYFRFQFQAPALDLAHHQHPFAKTLCLIGRPTDRWDTTKTVADFIREQLPKTLAAGRSDDPAVAGPIEEHQAEPFSAWYEYEGAAVVLVDSSWAIDPTAPGGDLLLGVHVLPGAPWLLRGAVLEVRDEAGAVVAAMEESVARLYPKTMRARWVRLPEAVRLADAGAVFEAALRTAGARRPPSETVAGGTMSVLGMLVQEEVRWRERGPAWVFVVRVRGDAVPKHRRNGGDPGLKSGAYFARAARAGRDDLTARVPALAPLRSRCIAIAGLGSLGAPSAIEFARGGAGELRLLDHDHVEPGTGVRWPLGLPAAGWPKAKLLELYLREQHPYTCVRPIHHMLGATRLDPRQRSDADVMRELTDGAALLFDATAELGVQHYLADVARERRIPFIAVAATPGGWGGHIVRVRPGVTAGCWMCLQYAWERDGAGTIPNPPADPEPGLQVVGCSDPTFTGAGFDMTALALGAVRLAVSTLCGPAAGYPDVDWDVAVVRSRTPDGRVVPPTWDVFPLERHPDCPVCAGATAR